MRKISQPKSVLIICLRRIGDVLMCTPLIRTLKYHWPKTKITVLLFKGSESILQSNKDIDVILPIEKNIGFFFIIH